MSGKQPAQRPTNAPKPVRRQGRVVNVVDKDYLMFEKHLNNTNVKNFNDYLKFINEYNEKFRSIINLKYIKLLEEITYTFYNDKEFIEFLKNYEKNGIEYETLLRNDVDKIIIKKRSGGAPELINIFDNNMLYVMALRYNNWELITALREKNVNIECFTSKFIEEYMSCRKYEDDPNRKKCIQKIIDRLFIKNIFNTVRHNLPCIDLILNIGITNVDIRHEYEGMILTPLGFAIYTKNINLAKILLEYKPNLNELLDITRDKYNRYLDHIMLIEDIDMLRLLKTAGITKRATCINEQYYLTHIKEKARNAVNKDLYRELADLK